MRKWKSKMPRGYGDAAGFILFVAVAGLFSFGVGKIAMFVIEKINQLVG